MFETPIMSGLHQKCGRCGKGKLFHKYLKFHDQCDHCGQDFSIADTADGPAFFVGSLMMIVFAPFYFILPIVDVGIALKVGLWVLLLSTMAGFCLILLPMFKGALFNLQIQHRAEEAKFESAGKHGAPPENWRY